MKLIQFEVHRKTGEIRADAETMDMQGAFDVMVGIAEKIVSGEIAVPGSNEWISVTDMVE